MPATGEADEAQPLALTSRSVMAGLDPATQRRVQGARLVRLGPRVKPADDGTEKCGGRPPQAMCAR